MKKNLLLFSLLLSPFLFTYGAEKDSNVIISNAKELFNFEYNKKEKSVNVKQELSTIFQCVDFRSEIPVVEFYDDKTSIDDVEVYVSERRAKNIIPTYEYYSIDNIFYSDAHVCYFTLPLEKKGSTSQVSFNKTISDPRYFTAVYFSDEYFIKNKIVTLTIPRWMKVELKELNFQGKDITKTTEYDAKKDADIITYTIKNIAARVSERQSPGASYTEPHLLVLCKTADVADGKITYFNTLNDQYAWYRSLTKDLGNNTTVLKSKALEITAGITNELDKIKKIFYWMQDNIRYIAFEDGIAGFKPEKADEVLRKKYGDCKGMAHLTKELLKALGFDARLCWIGTNHIAYDYSTPSIAVDNHMICALLYKGKTYFLDATENYIGFNEYAERIQGRQVLIEDGDKYIYTKVPATDYKQNSDAEKSLLSINGKDIEGTITREWKGEEKENIFAQLNAIKKENSKESFIRYLSDNNKDYVITDFTTSPLDNYDAALTVQYKIKHANAVSVFGKELYVDIDFRKDFGDFKFDVNERNHDYWFSFKTDSKVEVQLNIPEGYSITALPQNVAVKNEAYEFVANLTKFPDKIIYTKNIIIKNPRLKKAAFQQWNKDIEKLSAFYNEQIVLTKK